MTKPDKGIKKRRSIRFLILVIVSLIFAFLVGEVAIRQFSPIGYITPEILKTKSLQYEKSIFARNAFPAQEQKLVINNAKIFINKKGYRGEDFEARKPPGVIRIIFYGGSSVFDPEVSDEQSWPYLVETILNQKGYLQVEVINAGTPANKSFESWGRLFAEGHIFRPDYVVFSNQYNDMKYFRENKPILRQFNWFWEDDDPFVTYQNGLDRFLSEHLQLYVRLRTRYLLLTYKPTYEGVPPQGDYSDTISDLGLQQYKLSLQMFVDLARNINAIPILMTEPRLVDKENSSKEKKRIKYISTKLTHEALVEAFEKTDEIIRQVGKEKNVYVIDAAAPISGIGKYFTDHVHTNVDGSREVAEIMAEKLEYIIKNYKVP